MAKAKKKATRKKAAKRTTKKKPVAKAEAQGTCFVMMPFKPLFEMYYQAIFRPAVIKAKLEPVRANDLFRPSPIVADIWQMVQDAKVLLAELTTKNANVFYELGLAHAIGKPVILVSETMSDVPFDLQQLRVLLYDKDNPAWGEKLSEGITKAITETLDHPIEAVPSIFRKTVESQAPEQSAMEARVEALESQVRVLARPPVLVGRRQTSSHRMCEEELAYARNADAQEAWVETWSASALSLAELGNILCGKAGKDLPFAVTIELADKLHQRRSTIRG